MVNNHNLDELNERLFRILSHTDFLTAKGLANEVPLFIQSYAPKQEDAMCRTVKSLTRRLQNTGIAVQTFDLFHLVIAELEERGILVNLLHDEKTFEKAEMLDTLQNFSAPERIVRRLVDADISANLQLALVTGCGHVFPFLRTHAFLESLQPQMPDHPYVFFYPGQYVEDNETGSQLRLFASSGQPHLPKVSKAYYRAFNLENYHI